MLKKRNSIFLFTLVFFLNLRSIDITGQDEFQGWMNTMFGYNVLNQLYLEADFEYKWLLSKSNDPWNNLDITLLGEYFPVRLLDLTIEIINGKTRQSSDLFTYEASQRLGARWYFLQRGYNLFRISKGTEGAPERLELSNYIRFEHRSFDYYNDLDPEQDWRFRNRTQFIAALNKKTLVENRTIRLLADIEFFVPFGKDIKERYASKYRVRVGPGYRHTYRWRFDLFYMYDKSKDDINDRFEVSTHMIDLRIILVF